MKNNNNFFCNCGYLHCYTCCNTSSTNKNEKGPRGATGPTGPTGPTGTFEGDELFTILIPHENTDTDIFPISLADSVYLESTSIDIQGGQLDDITNISLEVESITAPFGNFFKNDYTQFPLTDEFNQQLDINDYNVINAIMAPDNGVFEIMVPGVYEITYSLNLNASNFDTPINVYVAEQGFRDENSHVRVTLPQDQDTLITKTTLKTLNPGSLIGIEVEGGIPGSIVNPVGDFALSLTIRMLTNNFLKQFIFS